MLKQHSLFSPEEKAVMAKPQYKQLDRLKSKIEVGFVDWLVSEFELPGCDARILAEEIVPKVIYEFQQKISPSAPDTYLPDKNVIENRVMDAMAMAETLDADNKLEEILANHWDREENEKHDIY